MKELFEFGLKGLNSFDKWIAKKSVEHDIYGWCAEAYRKKIIRLYDNMQIFGQTKSKPLTDIYIQVNILKNLTKLQSYTPEELNKKLKDDTRFGYVKDTKSGIDLVNTCDKLTVLGKPGQGKLLF